MKLLSLDLSTKCSGYAIFIDGVLDSYGSFSEGKYKNKSKDRYPAKSTRVGKIMAHNILDLVNTEKPDQIIIEEISPGFKQGVLQIKSLAAFHGMVMYLLHDIIDRVYFMPCTGKLKCHGEEMAGWRTILGLKKGNCWKESSMIRVKEVYDIEVENDDISDAILIGTAYLEGK